MPKLPFNDWKHSVNNFESLEKSWKLIALHSPITLLDRIESGMQKIDLKIDLALEAGPRFIQSWTILFGGINPIQARRIL